MNRSKWAMSGWKFTNNYLEKMRRELKLRWCSRVMWRVGLFYWIFRILFMLNDFIWVFDYNIIRVILLGGLSCTAAPLSLSCGNCLMELSCGSSRFPLAHRIFLKACLLKYSWGLRPAELLNLLMSLLHFWALLPLFFFCRPLPIVSSDRSS